ncbi:unnamed protein product, partial [marine sediment metagenome]
MDKQKYEKVVNGIIRVFRDIFPVSNRVCLAGDRGLFGVSS